ncbi:unnamed protein product [Cylicocyclus nassatus]|uniref:Uncharacterized protein n=1 Tax=Cylicocyclus nassatus TaxID=53992 RepID=A0AA36M1H7_CYLNA|nr:unnamed protein product [Cylicocyclus nassatus]
MTPNVDVTKIGAAVHHKQSLPRVYCGKHVLNTAKNVREEKVGNASELKTKNAAVDTNANALEDHALNQKNSLISLPVNLDYNLESSNFLSLPDLCELIPKTGETTRQTGATARFERNLCQTRS